MLVKEIPIEWQCKGSQREPKAAEGTPEDWNGSLGAFHRQPKVPYTLKYINSSIYVKFPKNKCIQLFV